MISTLAIASYRSLRDIVVPLGRLSLVTGPNGSGKSSLYRALRLLAETAQGRVVPSLAQEGGLQSTLWAGPERFSRGMREGDEPVQGTTRKGPVGLRLGFGGPDFEFPGARLHVAIHDGRFSLEMRQHGLLRPLQATELSDGTLRYVLWVAALLTPRPPDVLVLNEPETSLHPDLLPPLGRLIGQASQHAQVIVVSHAAALIDTLRQQRDCWPVTLSKAMGETSVEESTWLARPPWKWPSR